MGKTQGECETPLSTGASRPTSAYNADDPESIRPSLDLGSDVMRLSDAGIEVRFDVDPNHMHHKFALFDRRLLVTGSYNWTRGAAEGNYENIVVTDDPRLVKQFGKEFDRLSELFAPA